VGGEVQVHLQVEVARLLGRGTSLRRRSLGSELRQAKTRHRLIRARRLSGQQPTIRFSGIFALALHPLAIRCAPGRDSSEARRPQLGQLGKGSPRLGVGAVVEEAFAEQVEGVVPVARQPLRQTIERARRLVEVARAQGEKAARQVGHRTTRSRRGRSSGQGNANAQR